MALSQNPNVYLYIKGSQRAINIDNGGHDVKKRKNKEEIESTDPPNIPAHVV
jgi:hypothetical protein